MVVGQCVGWRLRWHGPPGVLACQWAHSTLALRGAPDREAGGAAVWVGSVSLSWLRLWCPWACWPASGPCTLAPLRGNPDPRGRWGSGAGHRQVAGISPSQGKLHPTSLLTVTVNLAAATAVALLCMLGLVCGRPIGRTAAHSSRVTRLTGRESGSGCSNTDLFIYL